MTPLDALTWRDHLDQLEFFVKSPTLLVQAAVPAMREHRFGRVIMIGSDMVDRAKPGWTAYSAAKAAQIGLVRVWARELGPDGITVNIVAPGWIPVERHLGADISGYLAEVPLGRMGNTAGHREHCGLPVLRRRRLRDRSADHGERIAHHQPMSRARRKTSARRSLGSGGLCLHHASPAQCLCLHRARVGTEVLSEPPPVLSSSGGCCPLLAMHCRTRTRVTEPSAATQRRARHVVRRSTGAVAACLRTAHESAAPRLLSLDPPIDWCSGGS